MILSLSWIGNNGSLPSDDVDSAMLASRILATNFVVVASDFNDGGLMIDFRPDIGSNRSRIESRGLFWPELGAPFDRRKSKSVEFKITETNRGKNEEEKKFIFKIHLTKIANIAS